MEPLLAPGEQFWWYDPDMYKVCLCVLLAALSLFGQTPDDVRAMARLRPALSRAMVSADAPDDSVSRTLVNAMTAIANHEHQPTRQELVQLADALRGAIAGKQISDAQLAVLSRCVVDALRGEGGSNLLLASQVRATLGALRVGDAKVDLIIQRFVAIGEAVRGPDDLPVSDKPVSNRLK
jgi:hypothetical protein